VALKRILATTAIRVKENALKNSWPKIVKWLVILAMPFFLGFNVVTLIVSPAYPTFEYAKDNFPPDPLGLTQDQRLDLALVAVRYLQKWDSAEDVIFMLEEQVLPDTGEPLYKASEIQHMIDVKVLTDTIRILGIGAAVIVVGGLAALLWKPATRLIGYKAIFRGGLLTSAILFAIAMFILLAWSVFFVQFHELLFPPGSWTFFYTDGLIRLFPEKFWFDIGVLLSVSILLLGIGVTLLGYFLVKRNAEPKRNDTSRAARRRQARKSSQ
jgi:integral membrane protein (TIGR01906 family)